MWELVLWLGVLNGDVIAVVVALYFMWRRDTSPTPPASPRSWEKTEAERAEMWRRLDESNRRRDEKIKRRRRWRGASPWSHVIVLGLMALLALCGAVALCGVDPTDPSYLTGLLRCAVIFFAIPAWAYGAWWDSTVRWLDKIDRSEAAIAEATARLSHQKEEEEKQRRAREAEDEARYQEALGEIAEREAKQTEETRRRNEKALAAKRAAWRIEIAARLRGEGTYYGPL
jgi:hypothetical protein